MGGRPSGTHHGGIITIEDRTAQTYGSEYFEACRGVRTNPSSARDTAYPGGSAARSAPSSDCVPGPICTPSTLVHAGGCFYLTRGTDCCRFRSGGEVAPLGVGARGWNEELVLRMTGLAAGLYRDIFVPG